MTDNNNLYIDSHTLFINIHAALADPVFAKKNEEIILNQIKKHELNTAKSLKKSNEPQKPV